MADIASLYAYDLKNPKGAGSSANEKLFMWGLMSQCKYKTALEVGVSRGHMTLWMAYAQSMHDGKLTSVDDWSRAHGGESTSPAHATKRLKDNRLQDVVTFVSSDSYKYLSTLEDNSVEFVWIDADHSYEGAYRDIKEAVRVASQLVGVHDTNQGYKGPREACMDIELDYGLQGTFVEGHRGIWLCNM